MKKQLSTLFLLCGILTISWSQDAFREVMSVRNISFKGENRGVAIADYDNDGDDDLYISIANGPNQLYQNMGNEEFAEVAAFAGVAFGTGSRSGVWGDINNDGWLDLYLSNNEVADVLYLNNGDGTFTDISQSAGISNIGVRPLSVNMCDVDNDGFVDIYVANFRQENVLYHNNGNLTFSNYIYPSNARDVSLSMGAVFFDYDNDGDSDLYLTHDGDVPNILYQNNGKGFFTDVSVQSGANFAGQGMGTDFGDFNNDGFFDIYITNLFENALLLNNGDGTFTNIAASAGVDDYGMGWGNNFWDFDNDGKLDIYVSNDSYFSPYPNVLYKNMGDNKFEKMAQSMVAAMGGTYGSACGDFNNDGSLDIAIANSGPNEVNRLFQNMGNAHHWIGFKLEGVTSNRAAIGARVTITDENGVRQMDEVTSGSGFAAQNSLKLHFGTGESQVISNISVRWPSGLQQEFTNLAADAYYAVVEGGTPEKIENTLTSVDDLAQANIINFTIAPNPATSEVQMQYYVPETADITISVWNAQGQQVETLVRARQTAGMQHLTWNVNESLTPGLYFIKMDDAGRVFTQKIVVR